MACLGSAVEADRAARIGEGMRAGLACEARVMSSGDDCSEMVGCESPRRTRLIDVGE
jgi:hypothetical protein